MSTFKGIAAVALLVLGSSASAGELTASQPAMYLGLSVQQPGGQSQLPRFSAEFGVQIDGRQPSHDAAGFAGLGRAPIFHFGVDGSNPLDVRVLGRSMLSQPRLDAVESGSASSGNWMWWSLGALAAGAAVAIAAGGGDDNGSDSSGSGDCASAETGVGNGGVVDPGNGSVSPGEVDNSGCPGP